MGNYLSPFLFNFNEVIDLDTEIMIPESILYKLLDRTYRSFVLLKDFGFLVLDNWIETRQNKMKSHLSFISMNVAKKKSKRQS